MAGHFLLRCGLAVPSYLVQSMEVAHVFLVHVGGRDVAAASKPPLRRQALILFCLEVSAWSQITSSVSLPSISTGPLEYQDRDVTNAIGHWNVTLGIW